MSLYKLPKEYIANYKDTKVPLVDSIVDFSQPITRNLELVVLPNTTGEDSLVSNWKVSKQGQNIKIHQGRRVLDLEGASKTSTDCGYHLTKKGNSSDILDNNFTFVFDIMFSSYWDSDGRNTLLDSRDVHANTGYVFFTNNSSGANSLIFEIDIGPRTNSVIVINNFVEFNVYKKIALSVDLVAGKAIIASDGKVLGTGTFQIGDYQKNINYIPLLRRGLPSGTSLDNNRGNIAAIYGFSRSLSEEECKEITKYPYNILKPKHDLYYNTVELSGTTHEAFITLSSAINSTTNKQAVLGASSGFDVDSGINQDRQAIFETASNLAQQLNLASTLGSFIGASASFGTNQEVLTSAVSNLIAQSTLQLNSEILESATTVLGSNVSLSTIQNIVSVAGADIEAVASLLVSKFNTTNYSVAIEGVSSFNTSCSIAAQVIANLTTESAFNSTAGLIAQTNAILLAQTQLNAGTTFSVLGGQVIDAFGTLSVTSSIGTDGNLVTSIELTPIKGGNNIIVTIQDKIVTVANQNRNVDVIN